MNGDIRISTTLFSHRKTKKLRLLLGADSVISLLTLWTKVATEKPDGVLTRWTAGDIAIESDYTGDSDEFVSALLDIGFLDHDGKTYSIHNWCDKQPWASNSRARSLAASKNVLMRWSLKEIPKDEQEDFKRWYWNVYKFSKGDNTESVQLLYGAYTDGISGVYEG